MALHQASDFTGFSDSFAAPAGSSDVIFTGSVDVIFINRNYSASIRYISTALKCTYSFMGINKLYSLPPNEDVTIINLRSKLWVLGNTYMNQEMMSSCVFTYHGNQVQAIHRSMADFVSLPEALASVGFVCIGPPWSTDSNPKMETDDKNRPRTQVADYVYKNPTLPHTNLVDSGPTN